MKKLVAVLASVVIIAVPVTKISAASHMRNGHMNRMNLTYSETEDGQYINNHRNNSYYESLTEEEKQVMIDQTISSLVQRKDDAKVRLDSGLITQETYDYIVAMIDGRIKDVEVNGVNSLYCHGGMMNGNGNGNGMMNGRGGCHNRTY